MVEKTCIDEFGQIITERSRNLYEIYENSGVLIFAMQDLFDKICEVENKDSNVKFQLKLSYYEIYNEVIHDLLTTNKQEMTDKPLTIHEGKSKEFYVKGANEIKVSSIHEVLELISMGEQNRHYAETFLNHCSSRSHTMFRLSVDSYHRNERAGTYTQTTSFLNFVDLAGSEKISNYFGGKLAGPKEFNTSTRLKEGLSINKSLFNLTQVIHMLSQNKPHIPYRNSTLTKILRSSLGGNSKTSIIICITPASS
jgi:hypothetical protein